MKRTLVAPTLLILVSCLNTARADDSPSPAGVPEVVKGITGRELGGHMKFLASDLMRGRDTASPEIRLAAEYIASRLSAAGAQPAGERGPGGSKTYFQQFPLEVVTPQLEGTSVSLSIEQNGSKRVVPCALGVDVSFFPYGLTAEEIDAPVVFASYGQVNTAEKIDDFEGIDAKGKFVLTFSGQRPGKDTAKTASPPTARRGRRIFMRGGGGSDKALEHGALGTITISSPTVGGQPSLEASTPMALYGFGQPSMTLGHAPGRLPSLMFADPIRDTIVRATGLTADSKPMSLDGLRVRFKYAAKKESKEDRNVIGLFPGTDAEKAKEVVIFSAHYDHVGVDDKGEIFNGSDDNASGTSALLEIAEAFGDGPRPARSVAFLWVSGEEKGLLGSQWFSDHVSLPEGYKIVADINLDMVSRNDGKTIGITPSDKHADYSTLIPAAQAAAKEEGLTTKFDADAFYFRTDSYNFARKGIPVIFFFCGVHEDYHRATDDFTKADFEKAARVARTAYRLGWQVAQEKDAPKKIKAAAAAKTVDSR
jgi:Peptidase family M28